MKYVSVIVSILFAFGCKEQALDPGLSQLNDSSWHADWLIGEWVRREESTNGTTYESWTKVSPSEYKGHGYIISVSDTVWEERMILLEVNDTWKLEVETPGNDDKVIFTLSDSDNSSFTVENPTHDFPKSIKYWNSGELLHAEVTGGSDTISFAFKKR